MAVLPGLPGGSGYRPFISPTLVGTEQSTKFGPLREGERGVVLWAGIQVDPSGWTMSGMPLSAQQLRSALYLWDRIDWPTNDFLSCETGPDEQFLVAECIMRRSRFATNADDAFRQATHSNILALEEAEKREPGKWSLSREAKTTSPIADPRLEGRSVLVRLYECIPVPYLDVPLADILEFKSRRRDELLNLRHHVERIYQSILSAPDRSMAEDAELTALDRAIGEHLRVMREAPFRKVLSSLEANFDLQALGAAGTSTLIAFKEGLPVTSALLSGAGALGVSLGFGRLKKGQSNNPFEYVTLAHKEL